MDGSWKQQLLQLPKRISAFSELNEIKYTTGGGEMADRYVIHEG